MSLFLQTLVPRGILSGEQEHRQEEFHMKKILTQYGVFALAIRLRRQQRRRSALV
jgi:hypothetical protein